MAEISKRIYQNNKNAGPIMVFVLIVYVILDKTGRYII